MSIITKAEHMFSTGVFNSYCATLHFDYRVNPNVAERINFDIKNVEHLPALTVVDFFNEDRPNILFIQDVTKDGVMPEIKRDLLFKLFDAKNVGRPIVINAFESKECTAFKRHKSKLKSGALVWLANDPIDLPSLEDLNINIAT
jgi:hypothetical protein